MKNKIQKKTTPPTASTANVTLNYKSRNHSRIQSAPTSKAAMVKPSFARGDRHKTQQQQHINNKKIPSQKTQKASTQELAKKVVSPVKTVNEPKVATSTKSDQSGGVDIYLCV